MSLLICSDCLEIYSKKRNHCPNCKSKASDYLGIFPNFSEAQKEKERIEGVRSGPVMDMTKENIASQ